MQNNLTPIKIVDELNKYIISQDDAKKNVAISLRNRFRRKEIKDELLKDEIMPKNIILIGPTGVGKTEIARRLAKITNSPFIKVEATKYTEVGYVGKDVESMVKDLVSITFRMVKDEKMEKLKESLLPIVYERIAKKLAPYSHLNDDEKNETIDRIKNGMNDDHEIEVEIKKVPFSPVVEVYSNAPNSPEEMSGGIQDMIDGLMSNITGGGKNKKTKLMKVKHAIDYFLKEEIDNKVDKDEIIAETIDKVEQDGIIFIDEIDKIAEKSSGNRGDVSRQGVQRDILPIVEGTTVMTKYGPVKTDHILFIAAGAFSIAKPSDLMPELQGRFPVRVNLESLSKEDFVKILTSVDYNLITQYKELLKIDNVDLKFEENALETIAQYAIDMNNKVENIGARRLATVLEEVLKDVMYEAPFSAKSNFVIDSEYINNKLNSKVKKVNLNDYIL